MPALLDPLARATDPAQFDLRPTGPGAILDIGCGIEKHPGAVGLDISADTDADIVHDLDVFPYPIEDGSSTRSCCRTSSSTSREPIRVFEELHRVARPGARIQLRTPHFSSVLAYCDPTHRHYFSTVAIRSLAEPRFAHYTDVASARSTSRSTSGCRSGSPASPRWPTATRRSTSPTSRSASDHEHPRGVRGRQVAPMRVVVNGLFLAPAMGGLETYVLELCRELLARARLAAPHGAAQPGRHASSSRRTGPRASSLRCRAAQARGPARDERAAAVGAVADRRRFDVVHSLAMTGPLVYARGARRDDRRHHLDDASRGHAQPPPVAHARPARRPAGRPRRCDLARAGEERQRTWASRRPVDVIPLGFGSPASVAPTPDAELRGKLGLGAGRSCSTSARRSRTATSCA